MSELDIEAAKRGDLALYSTREAAAYLRMSPSTIRRLIAGGRLTPDMLGGVDNRKSHIFRRQTLEAYVSKPARARR